MELSKIDLSAIAAIGHDYDHLGLLIDTGEHIEYVEIEAPIYAYEGLQELAEITQEYKQDYDHYTHEPIVETHQEYYPTVSDSITPGVRGYYEISQQVEFIEHQGDLYKYQKTVEVIVEESLSKVEPDSSQSMVNQEAYLSAVNYEADSQRVTMEFDDGSVYQYEEVSPDFWEEFKGKIA